METSCTFRVVGFDPVDYAPEIQVGVGVGHAHMAKEYDGEVAGRSITQFSYAYDDASNTGTYVATESFEGTVDGHAGTFAFVHSATTRGGTREHELFVIVPGSGTSALTGITGTGALRIDEDGTHRISLDYELAGPAQ
jgi:hypothetical protein